MQLFFLNPVFKERIWGGTKLYDNFNFPIPSMHTGECWAISAHKNGETTLKNGEFAGYPLSQIWREQPQLFGNDKAVGEFPLLIKILDANADLSVQVHPDDIYARKMENDRGKNECWYILDAKPDAKIIYGHKAASIDNFKQLALSGKWTELLTTLTVKPGDFFDVPTGTVHAIGSGILILEVQQSSDTTYRLYDYDRRDDSGRLRELHLDKAFEVVNVPHHNSPLKPVARSVGRCGVLTLLVSNESFQVQKLEVLGSLIYEIKVKYLLVTVIEGAALINKQIVQKGDSFIVPHQIKSLEIEGEVALILSNE